MIPNFQPCVCGLTFANEPRGFLEIAGVVEVAAAKAGEEEEATPESSSRGSSNDNHEAHRCFGNSTACRAEI